MIWLILLILVAAVVVFAMHFRRQARAREAASAERMKAFLDQARTGTTGATGAPGSQAGAPVPAATPVPPAVAREAKPLPAQTVSGIRLRAPVLGAEQQAAYALLKSALVGQEVLAHVSLAAIVAPSEDVTGFAREAAQRRLTDTLLDFLVCDAAFRPLAVLQCGARAGKAAQDAAYAQSCALSLGLRWVELDPSSLPPADVLRQRVLGT